MSGKYALIIGNTEYIDPGLAQLAAPGRDAEDFARVLKDKNICAFDEVKVLLNQLSSSVVEVIDEFFDQRKPDDLLVVYFSGHGARDELGSLYLAVKNTIRSRLRSTAIRSDYIREAMDQSRSKRQVLILDCCNSGAFPQGTKAEIGGVMGLTQAFQGYGRFVLTASDATQFAWEGNKIIGETDNSLFTHFLVQGLEGAADRDGDGKITVDELYDYAFDEVSKVTPNQTPTKSASKQEGEIVLRRITRLEDIKPISLPDELVEATEDSRTFVRESAIQQLEKLLKGKNLGLARSAREALERMEKEDDSRRVSQAATQALESIRQAEREAIQKAEEERLAAEKAEADLAQQKAEAERLALERAEAERLLAEQKAEEERKAKKEAKRLATLKAKEERLAREKAETERKAKEEAERLLAGQKAEEERRAREEAERLKARQIEEERLGREKAEAKRQREEVEVERRAKEEAQRLAANKAERQWKEEAQQLAAEKEKRKVLTQEISKLQPEAVQNVYAGKSTSANVPQASSTTGWIVVITIIIVLIALLNNLPSIFGAPATATQPPAIEPPATEAPITTEPPATEAPATERQSTDVPATKQPTLIPTPKGGGNGQIAFLSHRSSSNDFYIYIMNADGSGQSKLTSFDSFIFAASWSPNGKQIAFSICRQVGGCDIHKMNVDGSELTRLTYSGDIYWGGGLAWSPDGKFIAYISEADGNAEIYLINSDGSEQRRLTNNFGSIDSPAWSPDGKQIAFVSNLDDYWGEIYIMNADASEKTRLTNNKGFQTTNDMNAIDGRPAWSPDGKQIAFNSSRDGNSEIYIMNVDGSGVRRLTFNESSDFNPSWSPDGKLITFSSDRDGNSEIYVMSVDGSGVTRLTFDTEDDSNPAWLPAE